MRLDPSRTALLVIDVQDDYWRYRAPQMPPADLLPRLANLLSFARDKGIKVIHVQHISRTAGPFFQAGTKGAEFRPEVAPEPGEAVVVKHTPGSFYETNLDEILRAADIQNLFITGMQTHHCCDTTTREASARGYSAYVIADGVATFDLLGHDGTVVPRADVQRATLAVLSGFGKVVAADDFLDPESWS